MPLEVREIGIRMRVLDAEQIETPPQQSQGILARDEIVDECVRRVLATLKNRQER